MEKTLHLSQSEPALSTMVNQYGHRKFWAGAKKLGLDADDLDPNHEKYRVVVHERVPTDSVTRIKEHRSNVWDNLRQDRLKALDDTLKSMNDEDVRHYEKCTVGVHAVTKDDLPPVDTLAGMDRFNEMQEATRKNVKALQARKAKAMGVEFLMEKKKKDDADAKVAAFEKRMKDYRAAQQKQWDERKKQSEQKANKRANDARQAAEARAEWEDETEAKLQARMQGAKERRGITYSPATIAAKLAANKQKRIDAFYQACEQEKEVLKRMADKQQAVAERLEEDRIKRNEFLEQRRQDAADKFQQKQIAIYHQTDKMVKKMLDDHGKHQEKLKRGTEAGIACMKERKKSTVEFRDKMLKLWQANHRRLEEETAESNDALMQRHHEADVRREELESMKLKNENDIFSYREVKHKTFGELTKRRQAEIRKRTDAQLQALVYHVAERQHMDTAQNASKGNLWKCRQEIAKESLTFQDQAYEGFIKIQREPDERKVIEMMNALGFDMPKLPEEDEIPGDDGGGQPAY